MSVENKSALQENPFDRAHKSLELPLASKEFTPESFELIQIGSMVFGRAAWGREVLVDEILQVYRQHGLYTPTLEEDIRKLGFRGGYRISPEVNGYSDEYQKLHAGYIAKMARELMRVRGWDGIDVLVVASSTSKNWVPEESKLILKSVGASVEKSILYAQACNGTVAAISDLGYDASYKDARCVVIGLDTLSTLVDPTDPLTYNTFGNGISGCAFIAGQEVICKHVQTLVNYDPAGPIRGKVPYKLPSFEYRTQCPDHWYKIADEMTEQNFVQTKNGDKILAVPESLSGFIEMDGIRTLEVFKENVPSIVRQVFDWYRQNTSENDRRVRFAGIKSHQPSSIVREAINRIIRVEFLCSSIQGMDRNYAYRIAKHAKSNDELREILKQKGIEMPEIPQISWDMQETGFNNISAGTAFIALIERAKRGEEMIGKDHLFLGFGIGWAITGSIIEFCEQH